MPILINDRDLYVSEYCENIVKDSELKIPANTFGLNLDTIIFALSSKFILERFSIKQSKKSLYGGMYYSIKFGKYEIYWEAFTEYYWQSEETQNIIAKLLGYKDDKNNK